MREFASKSPAKGSGDLSLKDTLSLAADALQSLHSSNLLLQDRISVGLKKGEFGLIEDLQALDRQGQIALDISRCLRKIAVLPEVTVSNRRYSSSQLFELDATRDAASEAAIRPEDNARGTSEDIWL